MQGSVVTTMQKMGISIEKVSMQSLHRGLRLRLRNDIHRAHDVDSLWGTYWKVERHRLIIGGSAWLSRYGAELNGLKNRILVKAIGIRVARRRLATPSTRAATRGQLLGCICHVCVLFTSCGRGHTCQHSTTRVHALRRLMSSRLRPVPSAHLSVLDTCPVSRGMSGRRNGNHTSATSARLGTGGQLGLDTNGGCASPRVRGLPNGVKIRWCAVGYSGNLAVNARSDPSPRSAWRFAKREKFERRESVIHGFNREFCRAGCKLASCSRTSVSELLLFEQLFFDCGFATPKQEKV